MLQPFFKMPRSLFGIRFTMSLTNIFGSCKDAALLKRLESHGCPSSSIGFFIGFHGVSPFFICFLAGFSWVFRCFQEIFKRFSWVFMNSPCLSSPSTPCAPLRRQVETLGFQHMDLELTAPRVQAVRDIILGVMETELGTALSSAQGDAVRATRHNDPTGPLLVGFPWFSWRFPTVFHEFCMVFHAFPLNFLGFCQLFP